MSAAVPRLGKVRAVTRPDGETFVCVDWPRGTYGHTPETARELAAALLAVAGEAEAKNAARASVLVQDELREETA